MLLRVVSLLLFPLAAIASGGGSELSNMDEAMAIQMEALARMRDFLGPESFPQSSPSSGTVKREVQASTITFKNPAAKKFAVDGTKIPDGECRNLNVCLANAADILLVVPFDAGPSWSGLMPISGAKNETRKLFFW